MGTSVKNTIALVKKSLSRLEGVLPLATSAKADSGSREKFLSAYRIATNLYKDIQNLDKQTATLPEDEGWEDLSKLILEVDLVMITIDSEYQSLVKTDRDCYKSEKLSAAGSHKGSRESLHSIRTSGSVQQTSNVRLPQINLPTFDGDLRK